MKLTSFQFSHYRTVSAQPSGRKRKRQQELQDEVPSTPAGKKLRTHPKLPAETSDVSAESTIDPVEYWSKEGRWPKE